MKRGLFINNKKAKDSIYESGYMVYQCLSGSVKYQLDYCEVDETENGIDTGYDFYFFNYHPATMRWLDTKHLKKRLGFVATMILEVAPGDAFVMCPENDFDLYCALDPTIKPKQKNLFAFPRPLEKVEMQLPGNPNAIPTIGSFGFATKGKGFEHVVDAVNKEFDKAIIRINIPYGDFVPDSKEFATQLGNECKQRAKPGIEVRITHDFMAKNQLIKWCSDNTLNCFLYDRNMPGLAATTDQAIVSGRPLSVSANDTFRHITEYLNPYPAFSLKHSIEYSTPLVERMQRDWSPENFKKKFEDILEIYSEKIEKKKLKDIPLNFMLPVKRYGFLDILKARYKKYKRKMKKLTLGNIF